jgi:hypothetical protein
MNSYRVIGYDNHEMYHSGILGMHWGERLYQNKDGSLTPLGRIHYHVGMLKKDYNVSKTNRKKVAEQKAESSKKKTSESTKKKSIDEMTNAELDAYITRLEKEKRVKELQSSISQTSVNSSSNKEKSKKGESFIGDIAKTAGKTILTAAVIYTAGGVVNAAAKANVVQGGKKYESDAEKAAKEIDLEMKKINLEKMKKAMKQ